MKCLRSGYWPKAGNGSAFEPFHCCIQYEVIILVDPDLGLIESNMEAKHTGDYCRHLVGVESGSFSCAIHEHPIYKQTPCYAYGQVEVGSTNCRTGEFFLRPENQKFRDTLARATNEH